MARMIAEGSQVRVTAANRVEGYTPGQAGRVVWVSRRGPPDDAVAFYHVEMDATGPSRLVAFYPGEVEPEEAWRCPASAADSPRPPCPDAAFAARPDEGQLAAATTRATAGAAADGRADAGAVPDAPGV